MDEFDIPIFKKSYDLYKLFYSYRLTIQKQDRYTLWQRCENLILDIIENLLTAHQEYKTEKIGSLERASIKLNVLRVLVRLLKDAKTIDTKKYLALQTLIDDIGRQLGAWLKSTKNQAP